MVKGTFRNAVTFQQPFYFLMLEAFDLPSPLRFPLSRPGYNRWHHCTSAPIPLVSPAHIKMALEECPLSCRCRQCEDHQKAAGECQLTAVEIGIRQFCKGPGYRSVNQKNSKCQSRSGCCKRMAGQEMPPLIKASGVADALVEGKMWPPRVHIKSLGPKL